MAIPKKYRNWEKLGKAAGGEKWFIISGQAIYGSQSMFASLPVAMMGGDCPVEESMTELFSGYPVNTLDNLSYSCRAFSFKGVSDYLPSPAAPDEADWMNTVLFKDDALWVTDNEMCLKVNVAVEEAHTVSFAIPREAAKILKGAASEIVAFRHDDLWVTFEFMDQSTFTFMKGENNWHDMTSWFSGWEGLPYLKELTVDKLVSLVDRNGAKYVSFNNTEAIVLDKDNGVFYNDSSTPIELGEQPATFPAKSFKKLMKMFKSCDMGEFEPEFDARYAPYPARFRFCDKQGRIVSGLLNCAGA